MKCLKWYLIAGAAIGTAGVVMAMAMQRSLQRPRAGTDEQRFHVRGEVRELDLAGRSIRIKHEEIPHYMAAMTMPFDVRDQSLLDGLKAGDEVGFELIVTKEESWIASIHKLS